MSDEPYVLVDTRVDTLAFHGDPGLRDRMLEEMERHIEADSIVGGSYGGKFENAIGFSGCFIGCTAHMFDGRISELDSTDTVERAYNFDPLLTRICENIFEALADDKQPRFFRDVVEAASVGMARGVNVRFVHWQFLLQTVKRALKVDEETELACQPVIELLRHWSVGGEIDRDAAARASADAAYAADRAAYAAARAAYAAARAAYSADDSAARVAAYAADAAAYSACADADTERRQQWQDLVAVLRGDK